MPNNKRLIAYIVNILNDDELMAIIDDNMISCEFGALDRGSLTDVVDWGIYANRGSLSFIDKLGFFNNQNINSPEILNYSVKFYLVDKISRTLVATFKIDSVDFEDETRMVNINVVSRILELQTERTQKSVYPFNETTARNLVSLINDVTKNFNFSIGEDFPYIVIGCPYIGADTVWNVITKICQATMCRVVEDPSGNFEITSSFPERTPIIVNPNNIISVEKSDFVKKSNPHISITKRKKFYQEILEKSKNNFYIDWDIEEPNILDSTGITNLNLEKEIIGDEKRFYAEGKVIVETPYKIYYVGTDRSTYNLRHIYFSNSDDEYPYSDSKFAYRSYILHTPSIENEQNIVANLIRRVVYQEFPTTSPSNTGYKQFFFSDGTISFPITTFEDTGVSVLYASKDDSSEEDKIESNDLIQDISKYEDGTALGLHIIDEVYKRYHKGIECFEMECLFNDYYDEDGNKVFDREDLSKHFNRYDVVIPYVKKKGRTVPLRVNEDGTPKKFRIIGISYSYDGLLKQKLQLQEERYDVD